MTNSKSLLALMTGVAALAAVPTTAAAVPSSVPIQGVLTDGAGTPLQGAQQLRLRLYTVDTGGTAVHDETQIVAADRGAFTTYLGTTTALDLAIFDGATLWLGIMVGADAEMTPRLALGSVPYAAFAAECASVPTGSIMFFDLPACPSGWSQFAALGGRVPLGLPAGGSPGTTVGTALANGAQRTISGVPAHTHGAGTLSAATAGAGGHSHTVNPASFNTASGGTHDHLTDLGNGGGTTYMPQWSGTDAFINATIPRVGFNGAHTHAIDVPSTTSTTAADHTHAVTMGGNTASTGVASVDVTMPYLQLVVCRKN